MARRDERPRFTPAATDRRIGADTAHIDPSAPWQNRFVESFHSRVPEEVLDVEEFSCLAEAQVVIEDLRATTTCGRPHSALGMRTPAAFAAAWAAHSELWAGA